MYFYHFIFLILLLGAIRLINKKKFLLSLIISLEFLLLKRLAVAIYAFLLGTSTKLTHVAIFILALSAVEARIGVSLVSLLSRKLNEVGISNLSNLKK